MENKKGKHAPTPNNKHTYEEISKCVSYNPTTGFITSVKKGHKLGSKAKDGYIVVYVKGKYYRAHRLGWLLTYGQWPAEYIDHINGNPSDNRLNNLREATNQQNLQNRSMHKRNKLGVKGVFLEDGGLFRAQLWNNGKFVLCQRFKTLGEAREAYQSKCVEVFGEWARPS